ALGIGCDLAAKAARVDQEIDPYRAHNRTRGSTGILSVEPRVDCQKTPQKMSGTEQRGVWAGGKKPNARSINRILKLFCKFQNPHSGAKILFRHAARGSTGILSVEPRGFSMAPGFPRRGCG